MTPLALEPCTLPDLRGSNLPQRLYSRRLEAIAPFRVMELLARAQALDAAGVDVVHMEVGEPDFATPQPILEAAAEAVNGGLTRYTAASGLPELRAAVAGFYASRYGCDVGHERILVTAGASGALLLATAMVVEPGDNLVMADPGYPCNRHFLQTFGGQAQLVAVGPGEDYQLNGALVQGAWDERTRGALLASPANPTGSVIQEGALRKVIEVVDARAGFLLMDEIYHQLTFTKEPPRSVLSLTNDAFVIGSFSKYFGMTGFRLGWLVVPEGAQADALKLAQNLFICPSTLAQHAALAAFNPETMAVMEAQRVTLQERRDFLVPALREAGFGVPRMPEGAFYVYAELPEGLEAEAFCNTALDQYHVSITPGTDFGFHRAQEHVRITYAESLPRLQEGVRRLARALR